MRFTISREKLQEGLAAVAASIPAKTTLPVLANILIETTENGIRLAGTDLGVGAIAAHGCGRVALHDGAVADRGGRQRLALPAVDTHR